MKRLSTAAVITFFLVATLLFSTNKPAPAFTEGKTIEIFLGGSPGGGHDTEARLIARWVGPYLPGKPKNIIVKNSPGAAGMVSTTHMYNRAKRDGTVWAIQSSSQLGQQVLGDPKPNFDVSQMPQIFSIAGSAAAIVRDSLGARKGKEIIKVDPSKIVVSGLGLLTVTFLSDIVGLEVMGIKGYKYVVGYPSTAQTTLAFASGEVSYVGGTGLHHVLGKHGLYYEPIQKGTAYVLWQTGRMTPEGKIARSPGTDILTFAEVYQQIHGKPPSGPAWEAYKLTGPMLRTLNRSLVLPPGVPEDRVAQLRAALSKLYANPGFIKEWEKIFGVELDFIPGEDADRIVKTMMGSSPGWDYLKEEFIPKLKAKR